MNLESDDRPVIHRAVHDGREIRDRLILSAADETTQNPYSTPNRANHAEGLSTWKAKYPPETNAITNPRIRATFARATSYSGISGVADSEGTFTGESTESRPVIQHLTGSRLQTESSLDQKSQLFNPGSFTLTLHPVHPKESIIHRNRRSAMKQNGLQSRSGLCFEHCFLELSYAILWFCSLLGNR